MLNLAVLLEDSAREVPNRDAVIFNDIKLNYAQVNGAANQVVITDADVRGNRQAFIRRGVDDADIAHARDAHVQRARNGRSGQRQHIDFGAQVLQLLLVGDAESLFLINNNKAEIPEVNVG